MGQAATLNLAICSLDARQRFFDLRQMRDIGDLEQTGAQRVIKIMRQIGNVIGKIGKLRFRRGKG